MENNNDTLISIITLTWNSEATIFDTVMSVKNQAYKNVEHIFIDNESKDRTIEIIENIYKGSSYKYKIIIEKDEGISDGFNKGIINSSGDIIGILNSDDKYLTNNVLTLVADEFTRNSSIGYVHSDMIFEDDQFGTNRRRPLMCSIKEAMPFNHPTMFFRKAVYMKYGLYSLRYKYTMDFEFVSRFYEDQNNFKVIGKYVNSEPWILMRAGGVSWKNEISSLNEIKSILKAANKYDFIAQRNIFMRYMRINVRNLLSRLKLQVLVKFWRNTKWKS